MISLPPRSRGKPRTNFSRAEPPARLENGKIGHPARSAGTVKEPAIALDRRLDVSSALFYGRRRDVARIRGT
jgi:hypothetical protein